MTLSYYPMSSRLFVQLNYRLNDNKGESYLVRGKIRIESFIWQVKVMTFTQCVYWVINAYHQFNLIAKSVTP